jgi:AraC family transcriptional regulator of adaptative response / DNA-3-methyladenine glycosylase II
MVERFGDRLPENGAGPDAPTLLFPAPSQVAEADLESIGIIRSRSRTIRALASAVASGDLVLDGTQDPEATRRALLQIPGIGAWTADIVALRALREPDAFPAGDLGLRRAYETIAKRRRSSSRAGLVSLLGAADAWRPWRSYAVIHLWTEEARRDALSR